MGFVLFFNGNALLECCSLRIKGPYNLIKPGALHLNYLCISKRFDSLATPKFDRKYSLVFRYCVSITSL
jgi:hypothetical protein